MSTSKTAATAEAQQARDDIMGTVRHRTDALVKRLHQDVMRLLEDAHTPPGPRATEDIGETATSDAGVEGARLEELTPAHRAAIEEAVQVEFARRDIQGLVKAEVDLQLRTITRLLQERLKNSAQPLAAAAKLGGMRVRRRG